VALRSYFSLSAAIVATILLLGCVRGGDQVGGSIGQSITAGDYQLTVTSMQNPAQPPDRFTNPKAGDRFVEFDILVNNLGQQHLPVAASYFTLRDTGGLDYQPRTDISSDQVLKQTTLAPGQHVQAQLYVEMAANQQPVDLSFSPAVVGWHTKIDVALQS